MPKPSLARLERGEKLARVYDLPVARPWQFGSDLTSWVYPARSSWTSVSAAGTAIGPLQLWIAAYCNDVFGYLLFRPRAEKGGTNAEGSIRTEGSLRRLHKTFLVAKVRELAQRSGRKLAE